MISASLAALLLVAEGTPPPAAGTDPGYVLNTAPFPYPSWEAAMDAMIENRDANIGVKEGWTVVDEVAGGVYVIWSFTPASHPAHPSVVRRTPIQQDGEVTVELQYRCDAKVTAACAGLLAEFRGLNEGMVLEFKRRLGLLDHPRKAEAAGFAERYLDLIEEGRDDETLEMLTTYSRTGYTKVAWHSLLDQQRRERGKLTLRRLRGMEWFDNPPGVEFEGTFAFMEFEVFYDSGKHLMEYLVLHSDKGAPFRVMHDEAPFLRLVKIRRAR